jgi:hypothetical protein
VAQTASGTTRTRSATTGATARTSARGSRTNANNRPRSVKIATTGMPNMKNGTADSFVAKAAATATANRTASRRAPVCKRRRNA